MTGDIQIDQTRLLEVSDHWMLSQGQSKVNKARKTYDNDSLIPRLQDRYFCPEMIAKIFNKL